MIDLSGEVLADEPLDVILLEQAKLDETRVLKELFNEAPHVGAHPGADRKAETLLRPAHHLARQVRSEEHTSELQSLMRISNAVFCFKKKTTKHSLTKQPIK